MSCKALSKVHGPTNAARRSRNRGRTHPHPLPPVLTPVGAFPVRAGLLRLFASMKLHFVGLRLVTGRSRSRCVLISWAFFAALPSQPGRFLRSHPEQSQCPQGNFDQQHLQCHHDLFFWSPQIKENRVACFGKGPLTFAAAEDAPFATLGEISGDGAHVAAIDQPIMGTVRVGARLAPSWGFRIGQTSDRVGLISILIGGLVIYFFKVLLGEHPIFGFCPKIELCDRAQASS